MPLGIISEEDYQREFIQHPPDVSKVIPINRGRGKGNDEVPMVVRKFIAEEVLEGANRKELARTMGVNPQAPNAYVNGATSTGTYNKVNDDLKGHIDDARARISDKAQNRLRLALNQITKEKLELASVKDVSSIAKDMASVVDKMAPKNIDNGTRVQLVIMAPPQQSIEKYEVIDVSPIE